MAEDGRLKKRCRYCGAAGDHNTLRYERGLAGKETYDCRDATACGLRLMMFKSVVHALRNARMPLDYPYNPSEERY